MSSGKNLQKGYSLTSILIGLLITAIVTSASVASMWGSVDTTKINTVASIIAQQQEVFAKEPGYDYDALNTNNDYDYLPEMVQAGLLTPIPTELFEDPSVLTWQIRTNIYDGYKSFFYTVLKSTNASDKELIDAAVAKLGFSADQVNVIP